MLALRIPKTNDQAIDMCKVCGGKRRKHTRKVHQNNGIALTALQKNAIQP